jgi:peptide/nickel transport system substrate-binding protein
LLSNSKEGLSMNQKKQATTINIVVFLILFLSSLSGCLDQADITPDSSLTRDSLTIGFTTCPEINFFPWIDSYDTITMMINMNIFNSLIEFDQIFRTKPKLATSWNNPNNLTWRFYLRKNVVFHNGYPFTAEDVKFTIDLIKNNESHVLRELLLSVKEVKIINNYTVDLITEKPCPILLNKLVDIPIASKKYVEETAKQLPVGTGPYKLVDYVPHKYVKLKRNNKYWDDLTVKNVTFLMFEKNVELKNATLQNEIDIACHIGPQYYDEISNCSGLRVVRCHEPTVVFLSFDFRENDSVAFKGEKNPLADIRVRKALYHSINITEIINTVLNGSNFAEPASQFVSPMIFGYNPAIERLPYSPETAKELMKEAGYEEGFELVINCPEEAQNLKRILFLLQTQLAEIIDLQINFLPIEDYYMELMSRNCSIYYLGWLAATGDGGEIYDYMIRSVNQSLGIGSYNLGYYSNPEVDRIGENISHILNPEDRLHLMQEGFRIAMNDIAWIPFYIPKCVYAIADDIAWEPGPGGSVYAEDIDFK